MGFIEQAVYSIKSALKGRSIEPLKEGRSPASKIP